MKSLWKYDNFHFRKTFSDPNAFVIEMKPYQATRNYEPIYWPRSHLLIQSGAGITRLIFSKLLTTDTP